MLFVWKPFRKTHSCTATFWGIPFSRSRTSSEQLSSVVRYAAFDSGWATASCDDQEGARGWLQWRFLVVILDTCPNLIVSAGLESVQNIGGNNFVQQLPASKWTGELYVFSSLYLRVSDFSMGGQGELVLLDGPPASFHQVHGCVFCQKWLAYCVSFAHWIQIERWAFGTWQMMLQWLLEAACFVLEIKNILSSLCFAAAVRDSGWHCSFLCCLRVTPSWHQVPSWWQNDLWHHAVGALDWMSHGKALECSWESGEKRSSQVSKVDGCNGCNWSETAGNIIDCYFILQVHISIFFPAEAGVPEFAVCFHRDGAVQCWPQS